MTTIRTLLLDDEPACLNTLQLLVERFCPTLTIIRVCTDPRQAIEAVLELQPDLLLLDIEMPELSGFDVLEKTRPIVQPEVIFATAHNDYAIRAFKFTSVDYLLKPVEAAELVAAVARATERIQLKKRSLELDFLIDNHRHAHNQPPKLALPTATGLSFVHLTDVIYLEAQGAYTRFYLQGKKEVLVSRNIGFYEEILRDHHFVRIHDRFIVNLLCVERYDKREGGSVVVSNGTALEVSRRRKEDFLKRMQEGG